MIEILHDVIYLNLRNNCSIAYMGSCRSSIMNSSLRGLEVSVLGAQLRSLKVAPKAVSNRASSGPHDWTMS